jgi:hypothetical protein
MRRAWRRPLLLLLFAILPAHAESVGAPAAKAPVDLLGTWHGTSTCVDKKAFPACKDEEVVYEATSVPGSEAVTVKADKVVDGKRLFMGDLTFERQNDGTWVAPLESPRYRGRWTLKIEGDRMTGDLLDIASGKQVRAVSLRRQPS